MNEEAEKAVEVYCIILIDELKTQFGGPLSKSPDPSYEPSPAQQKIYDLVSGASEITQTLANVDMAAKLISLTPPRSKGLNKAAYFSFLIGAYLQEVYILDQRLHSYAKVIARFFGGREHEGVSKKIMASWVLSLAPLIASRGSHVHRERYTDVHVRVLDNVQLLKTATSARDYDFDGHYADARYEWSRRTKENRAAITTLIDDYFRSLQAIIAPDGVFKFPDRFKDRKPRGSKTAQDARDRN